MVVDASEGYEEGEEEEGGEEDEEIEEEDGEEGEEATIQGDLPSVLACPKAPRCVNASVIHFR